jgi:hypothetical protein
MLAAFVCGASAEHSDRHRMTQEKISHEKKFFCAADGSLFVGEQKTKSPKPARRFRAL